MEGYGITWNRLMEGLPSALLAWGAYCVIIQVPWETSELAKAEKAANPRQSFSRVHMEKREDEKSPWVRVQSFDGEFVQFEEQFFMMGITFDGAGPQKNMRIIEESGTQAIRFVRYGR